MTKMRELKDRVDEAVATITGPYYTEPFEPDRMNDTFDKLNGLLTEAARKITTTGDTR
jgi:hypothetical protein